MDMQFISEFIKQKIEQGIITKNRIVDKGGNLNDNSNS